MDFEICMAIAKLLEEIRNEMHAQNVIDAERNAVLEYLVPYGVSSSRDLLPCARELLDNAKGAKEGWNMAWCDDECEPECEGETCRKWGTCAYSKALVEDDPGLRKTPVGRRKRKERAMERSANALTELARRMDGLYGEIYCNVGHAEAEDYLKAQRIVEELAKADKAYVDDCVHDSIVDLACEALKNCRAIAEEGDGDDY